MTSNCQKRIQSQTAYECKLPSEFAHSGIDGTDQVAQISGASFRTARQVSLADATI